jgi:hypothetical protein
MKFNPISQQLLPAMVAEWLGLSGTVGKTIAKVSMLTVATEKVDFFEKLE